MVSDKVRFGKSLLFLVFYWSSWYIIVSCGFIFRRYEKSFFDSVCRGDIYSLAAVYSQSPNIENKSNVEHRSNGNNTCDHAEYIAGVITVSQRPNIHLLPDVSFFAVLQ